MHLVDLTRLDLMEGWFDSDPSVHFRANFALSGGNGAEDASAVYVVLEPGQALGEHTDSPEEILLVLDGTVEVTVGDERAQAGRGSLAVVPAMVRHGIRNTGAGTARIVGFFPARGVEATFVEPVQPVNQQVMVFGDAAVAEPALV